MKVLLGRHSFSTLTKVEHSIWFDSYLYGLSAVFALAASLWSSIPLYREWGKMALWAYLAAFVFSVLLAKTKKLSTRISARCWLAGLLVIGAVVIPMALEISWRWSGDTQALHVQPEVVVVEHAAHQVVLGHDPYQARMDHGVLIGRIPGWPAYEAFFPYLPAMTLFGYPSQAPIPRGLGDARVWFFLTTALAVAMALWWLPVGSRRRLRALQVVMVMPWAALTMATGGDDLPIIALLLGAVVLTARRHPLWAGLVLGLVSSMKFTAWPLTILLLFAARDSDDQRRPGIMAAAIAGVSIPLVIVTLIANPKTFIANVVAFPLGLSGVASPAGSALPGHIFVSLVPSSHRIFPVVCALVGIAYLIGWMRRHRPSTVSEICRLAGWILLIAIALAPATRVGYLMYPLNFFVWSWMLSKPTTDELLSENCLLGPYSAAA